jgi:hypothetical protein
VREKRDSGKEKGGEESKREIKRERVRPNNAIIIIQNPEKRHSILQPPKRKRFPNLP